MKATYLAQIVEARAARRPLVRLRWTNAERELLVEGTTEGIASIPDESLRTAAKRALESDAAKRVDATDANVFVQPLNPPIRIAIVGAVHIAQYLSAFARDLGHQVVLIDPRRGFLTEKRFPGVTANHSWPGEALRSLGLDSRTALVTLSHDPKIDQPALEVGLPSPCFYVGALGSQKTQARRREQLREAGLGESAIARIHGPVGLDLGGRSPAEIALSICAEITQTLRVRRE